MEKTTCKECEFFVQHYILLESKLHWVNCGHCTKKRIHNRKAEIRAPDNKVCPEYVFAGTVESKFVTKEYLSKELLKRVLEMDLLPQMESWNGNK